MCGWASLSGARGWRVMEAIPSLARVLLPVQKHKPLCYLLPFVVTSVWPKVAAPA